MELHEFVLSVIIFIYLTFPTVTSNDNHKKNYRGRYTRQAEDFQIIIPLRVTYEGVYMSHMIPHHYKRSYYQEKPEIGPDDKIHYSVPIEGEHHHVELWPNHKLISPGMVVETRKTEDGGKSAPQKDKMHSFMKNLHIRRARDTQCHYRGQIRGDNKSAIALSTCYGLAGVLKTKRGHYFIEPVMDHDPYSGKEHPHMIYKEGNQGLHEKCGTKGFLFGRQTIDKVNEYMRRKRETLRRYARNDTTNTTTTTTNSTTTTTTNTTTVAVNTTSASLETTAAGTASPPPSAGTENATIVSTTSESNESTTTKLDSAKKDNKQNPNITITPDMPLNLEILLVLDKTLLDYHKDIDVENYVLTVMNMAYNLFHDSALGYLVNLSIVRIIRLEVEDDEMNVAVTNDAEKTLDAFCEWQSKMNPGDDCHPNHHDVAILITRTNICVNEKDCGMLGISKLGGTCDSKLSCCLCEDDGLKLGYVIAHELAHSLGIDHDDSSSGCNGTMPDELHTVMHPDITMKIEGWSSCSQKFLKIFIESGYATCLADAPADHDFDMVDVLPGVMYDGDFQCRMMIAKRAVQCYMGSTCKTLNCAIPGYTCLKTWSAPAPGTSCGERMWCFHHKCEPIGERPDAADGNWGSWSLWSACSRTCGSGIAYQERQCNNPIPLRGGKDCIGEKRRHRICSTEPCQIGQPSFRDVQCSNYKNWVFPEDARTHTWKGQFVRDENPCKLYCKNERGVVVSMKSTVTDGTSCMRGMRDICVAGKCIEIPCDLELGSNAVEDRCGVCHGDGQECDVNEGLLFFQQDTSNDMKTALNIPVKARNIKVKETEPTESLILVAKEGSKDLLTKGNLGMFEVPGSKAWIGMIKGNQEELLIPGPVSEALVVWVKPLENVSLQYSLAVSSNSSKSTPHFYWEYIDWNKCSAHCGPGTQISEAKCVEKEAGHVGNKYCVDAEPKPEDKSRPCEDGPCVPRWFNGDWDECKDVNSSYCETTRIVHCVKPIGEGEGETDIVEDNECGSPMPPKTKQCGCDTVVHKRNTIYENPSINFQKHRGIYENPHTIYKKRSLCLEDTSSISQNRLANDKDLHSNFQNRMIHVNNLDTIISKSTSQDENHHLLFNKRNEHDESFHSNFDQNRNPDEDPDQTTLEILGFPNNESQKNRRNFHYSFSSLPYVKRGCLDKNGTNATTTEINVFARPSPAGEKTEKSSRGRTVIDKEGLDEVKLQIFLEKDSKGNFIKSEDLPEPKNPKDNTVVLEGDDSLHFIEKVQELDENYMDCVSMPPESNDTNIIGLSSSEMTTTPSSSSTAESTNTTKSSR